MRFVPSIGGFAAEANAQLPGGRDFDHVFGIESAFDRTPRQRRVTRSVGVRAYVALQECLQVAEGNLAVLILNEVVVGLQLLQPPTKAEQMPATRESDLIRFGIQIARGTEIASRV